LPIYREYLAENEASIIWPTEAGHEAITLFDPYEAAALASRAQRELGGNWQALSTKVIEAEQRGEFSLSHVIAK